MATGPAARPAGAPLPTAGGSETVEETSDPFSSQPSSGEGGETPLTAVSRNVLRASLSAVRLLHERPLVLGAILLCFVSVAAGRAQWGFATTAQSAGLGGADVEEVSVQDPGDTPTFEDAALIRAAAAFSSGNDTFPWEGEDMNGGELVTIPWSPVSPTGTSGRNVASYVVEEGDTLSSIAAAFRVGTQSIAWSNNLVDPDSIRPGDTLRVPPVDGVLHIVKQNETIDGLAKKYSAKADQIIAFNGLPATGQLSAGDEVVVPGGTMPAPPPPVRKVSPRTPAAPQFTSSASALGYFIAPTTGHNYGRIHSHNGVDISNRCGTPVYAAASGKVARADGAGWNGGYGDVLVIDHPNGMETLYAHLSQFVVTSGEVGQGQLIAYMGTTGRSTGCHLHFEVHGGKNPLGRGR